MEQKIRKAAIDALNYWYVKANHDRRGEHYTTLAGLFLITGDALTFLLDAIGVIPIDGIRQLPPGHSELQEFWWDVDGLIWSRPFYKECEKMGLEGILYGKALMMMNGVANKQKDD